MDESLNLETTLSFYFFLRGITDLRMIAAGTVDS
jgi:hypothetical protein